MSTEAPPTNPIHNAAQQAAATHPANKGADALKVPLGEMIKTKFAEAQRIEAEKAPKQDTKTEAKTDVKSDAKTEVKTEVKTESEKKPKTSIFDRKQPETKTEEKTEAKAEDITGPEDKMELPEAADPTKKSQFAELKTITKQLRKELADKVSSYEKQLQTYKTAQPAEAADLVSLKERLKQAEDRLAIVDLQNHPDFAKQYVEPKNKALSEAKMLLTDNNAGEVDMGALLAKPRAEFAKSVSELASKMQDFDKAAFTNAMREAYRLQAESAQALTKSSELATQLQQKAAQHQKQAFEEVWSKLGPAGDFLITLDTPEGISAEERQEITAYNQEVQGVRANAEKYAFGSLDERQAASLASKAATMDFLLTKGIPRMEKEFASLVETNRRLSEELKAIKGAKEPGSVSGDTRPSGDGKPKGSLQDLISSAFKK